MAGEDSDRIEVGTVKRIATLARIGLPDEQAVAFTTQIASILDHFRRLAEVTIPPGTDTRGVFGTDALLREDVVTPGIPHAAFLALAPKRSGPFVSVPGVMADRDSNSEE